MILKDLIHSLQQFSLHNLKVKRFHFDFIEQMDNFSTENNTFPIVFVAPSFGMNVSNNNGYYGQEITLDVFVLDKINHDRSNITTIMTETNNIVNDIVIFFKTNPGLSLNTDFITTEPLNNYLVDNTAGYRTSLTFLLDSQSECYNPHTGDIFCPDSIVNIYNSIDTLLDTMIIVADNEYNYTVADATLYIKDEDNNIIDTLLIPAASTEDYIIDIPTSADVIIENSLADIIIEDTVTVGTTNTFLINDIEVQVSINGISQGSINIPYGVNETINIV